MLNPPRLSVQHRLPSQVVAPGDAVCQLPETGEVRVGSGVQLSAAQLRSIRAGFLRQTTSGKLWVEGRQKRCAQPHAVHDALTCWSDDMPESELFDPLDLIVSVHPTWR